MDLQCGGALPTALAIGTGEEVLKTYNSVKYEREIEAYNNKIEDYAKTINFLKLDDVQIFMKVVYDMRDSVEYCEEPEGEIKGFLELTTEKGNGACGNMANDVAKKLNKINPEYNAITVKVLSEKYKYDINNSIEDNVTSFLQNLTGDHFVVLAYVKKDNLVVMIDPTWKTLGVCKNGEIIVFYSNNEQIIFDIKEFHSILDKWNCNFYETLLEGSKHYAQSFQKPNLTFKEIKDKYGKQAQQVALSEVRKLKDIEKTEKREEFLAEVKVETITAGVSQHLIPKLSYKDTQDNVQEDIK